MKARLTKLIVSLKWLDVKDIERGILRIGIQSERNIQSGLEIEQEGMGVKGTGNLRVLTLVNDIGIVDEDRNCE